MSNDGKKFRSGSESGNHRHRPDLGRSHEWHGLRDGSAARQSRSCCRRTIGPRATALRFLAEGATVWATDINQAALDTLPAEKPAINTRILNVRDSAAVIATAQEIGAIDILFNGAGFVHQELDKEVVFRADAAFAKPDIYDPLEERG